MDFVKFLRTHFFIVHVWWLLLKAITTRFSIGTASRNQVSCFSRLFLTKVKTFINLSGAIQKSALNSCLIAKSFLLFHICWNHSYPWQKVQSLLSAFKSMTDKAIFKLCGRKNLFLSNINLYGYCFCRGFLQLLINCLNSTRSDFSFITA